MTEILYFLGLIVVTVGISALTGLGLMLVLPPRWLQRGRLENFLAWVFLGLGWWMLAFGWLTYLGLNARQLRWPLLASGLAWSVAGLWKARGALVVLWRSLRKRRAESIVFAVACLLSLVGLLDRAQRIGWPNPFNDTLTYASLSTYLQDHNFTPFAIPEVDSQQTVTFYAHREATRHTRMGATWLLAMFQDLTGRDALVVSGPLTGLGILLNLAGVYLLARWAARLAWKPAAGVVLFAAALGSPLQATVILGFQGQIFGTAYFVFIVALLAHCLSPRLWTAGTALVVSLATAAFLSCYHDMAPLLALIALGTLAILYWRARRDGLVGQLRVFTLQTMVGLLVLGNVEWPRTYSALRFLLGFSAGWKILWTKTEYLQFVLGLAPVPYGRYPASLAMMAVLLLLSALALAGCVCLVRRRNWVMLQALAVLALLTIWFVCVRDPITGHLGHRWSLFKLAKWAYPVVVVTPFVGLAWLRKRLLLPRLVFFVPGFVVVLVGLVMARTGQSDNLADMLGAGRPETGRRQMQAYLKSAGYESVCLVDPCVSTIHLQSLAGYVVRPLPIVNGWFGRGEFNPGDQDPAFDLNEKTLVMTWSTPPFEEPQERLPLGLNRLDVSRPHVYFLENPAGAVRAHPDGGKWTPLGEQPAKLHLWTPRAAHAVLLLRVETAAADKAAWQVRLKAERGGLDQQLKVRGGTTQIAVPVDPPAGRSRIEVSCKQLAGSASKLTLRDAQLRFSSSAPIPVLSRAGE